MAKSAQVIAAELHASLAESGSHVLTMTWPEMYALSGRKAWRGALSDQIFELGPALGVIFGFGQSVVLVARDEHFSPAAQP